MCGVRARSSRNGIGRLLRDSRQGVGLWYGVGRVQDSSGESRCGVGLVYSVGWLQGSSGESRRGVGRGYGIGRLQGSRGSPGAV